MGGKFVNLLVLGRDTHRTARRNDAGSPNGAERYDTSWFFVEPFMNINFELYKVFYHAAEKLSFTRAAEALFVTQSSVSQSIKQLESQLDVLLFVRNRRNMQLTAEGKQLFDHISQAFHQIKTGERTLEGLRKMEGGDVHIGASDTICRYFLLEHIKTFHNTYPKVRIKITNQPSMKTLEDVATGRLDFGVVNLPEGIEESRVSITRIKAFKEVAIATDRWRHELPENPSVTDLSSFPLISLTPNTHTRRYLDAFFRGLGERFSPEFELESVDLIVDFVRIGLGIGFVMEEALSETDLEQIHVVDLKEELPSRSIGMVSRKAGGLSIATGHLRDILMDDSTKDPFAL